MHTARYFMLLKQKSGSTHSCSEPLMSSTKQEQLKQETFHEFQNKELKYKMFHEVPKNGLNYKTVP
jgi:hypothetical protein